MKAALVRPFATFDQKDLYPATIEKAAALFESLVIGHPFIDGNKRTSYVLIRLTLLENNLDINATQDEKYNFVISASKGESKFEEITNWLKKHVTEKV